MAIFYRSPPKGAMEGGRAMEPMPSGERDSPPRTQRAQRGASCTARAERGTGNSSSVLSVPSVADLNSAMNPMPSGEIADHGFRRGARLPKRWHRHGRPSRVKPEDGGRPYTRRSRAKDPKSSGKLGQPQRSRRRRSRTNVAREGLSQKLEIQRYRILRNHASSNSPTSTSQAHGFAEAASPRAFRL